MHASHGVNLVSGRAAFLASSVGYLVPAWDFPGVVHSVFVHACNVAVPGSLLTLVARRDADAPTAIVLRTDRSRDLRQHFRRGMALKRNGALLIGTGVTVHLGDALVGLPGLRACALDVDRIGANVALVMQCMRGVALEGEVQRRAAALEAAVACCDLGAVADRAAALVGLGAGLTPSGDDFLVGLLAGLEMLVQGARREEVLAALRRCLEAQLGSTTDVSAHQLRLAAAGHFSGVLERLRNRIVGEPSAPLVEAALQRALDFGASSGADTVHGLLAAFRAWLPGASGGTT